MFLDISSEHPVFYTVGICLCQALSCLYPIPNKHGLERVKGLVSDINNDIIITTYSASVRQRELGLNYSQTKEFTDTS